MLIALWAYAFVAVRLWLYLFSELNIVSRSFRRTFDLAVLMLFVFPAALGAQEFKRHLHVVLVGTSSEEVYGTIIRLNDVPANKGRGCEMKDTIQLLLQHQLDAQGSMYEIVAMSPDSKILGMFTFTGLSNFSMTIQVDRSRSLYVKLEPDAAESVERVAQYPFDDVTKSLPCFAGLPTVFRGK